MLLYIFILFWHFFHHKICVFMIFISFFDEISNIRCRILTNQTEELVIRSCHWNCITIRKKISNNSVASNNSVDVIIDQNSSIVPVSFRSLYRILLNICDRVFFVKILHSSTKGWALN